MKFLIHKKSLEADVSNKRLLISMACKALGSIIAQSIYKNLNAQGLMSSAQLVYTIGCSQLLHSSIQKQTAIKVSASTLYTLIEHVAQSKLLAFFWEFKRVLS